MISICYVVSTSASWWGTFKKKALYPYIVMGTTRLIVCWALGSAIMWAMCVTILMIIHTPLSYNRGFPPIEWLWLCTRRSVTKGGYFNNLQYLVHFPHFLMMNIIYLQTYVFPNVAQLLIDVHNYQHINLWNTKERLWTT